LNTAKCKKTTPIFGPEPQPCKAKVNTNDKEQTSEQERTCPTAVAGPQTHKLEPNNNKNQSTNQRTNKQATTTKPVNNICIFNDDQIASQEQKKYETCDDHESGNN
jgi:hypothetical protein